jgi:copper oxidase (laccase) domain-containing protein
VAEKFSGYSAANQQFAEYIQPDADGLIHVDLKGIVREQLMAKGVSVEHIEINPDCTYCQQEKYFSRRRDAPILEAMISVICLKK